MHFTMQLGRDISTKEKNRDKFRNNNQDLQIY